MNGYHGFSSYIASISGMGYRPDFRPLLNLYKVTVK